MTQLLETHIPPDVPNGIEQKNRGEIEYVLYSSTNFLLILRWLVQLFFEKTVFLMFFGDWCDIPISIGFLFLWDIIDGGLDLC